MKSNCCNKPVLTALSTALEGQTNWYICTACKKVCDCKANVKSKIANVNKIVGIKI